MRNKDQFLTPIGLSIRPGISDGFTLVELMVVVALVGILAAVAIPQYIGFVTRARQVEGKIALSAMFAAEQEEYGEQASYSDCMVEIGYDVIAGSKRYYASGASSYTAAAPYIDPQGNYGCGPTYPNNLSACNAYQWSTNGTPPVYCSWTSPPYSGGYDATLAVGGHVPMTYANMPGAGHGVTSIYMVLEVAGYVDNSSQPDVWTIDQTKNIQQWPPAGPP